MRYASPEEHRDAIAARFREAFRRKYDAGHAEHGGQLWRKPGMERQLVAEALDFVCYVDVLAEQKADVVDLLRRALPAISRSGVGQAAWDFVNAALNILETGNAQGEAVEDR